jgi:TRAP-type C4-dicarboxylate transport system permease small subunit
MSEDKSGLLKPPAFIPSGVLRAGSIVLAAVRSIVNWVCIALISAMVFLILFQILGRYVFNYSISWSEEAAIFTQIWLVMLGAGVAMRNRHHAGVDMVIARCPPVVRALVKSASALLVVWFLLVVMVSSSTMIAFGMIVSSTALGLPMAIPYASLPIGLGYFLLEFAIATVPEILDPSAPPPASEPVE